MEVSLLQTMRYVEELEVELGSMHQVDWDDRKVTLIEEMTFRTDLDVILAESADRGRGGARIRTTARRAKQRLENQQSIRERAVKAVLPNFGRF
jgi:hypothetical protein